MRKILLLAGLTNLLVTSPIFAGLIANENTTQSGGFWNYSYTLGETGVSVPYTDILLSTADLSPTNVAINFNGGGAGSWTWVDFSASQLDFFNSGTGSLNLGDSLVISFRSFLPPGPQTVQGFNINTSAVSNIVNTSGPSTIPEPGTLGVLAFGIGALALV